MEWVKDNCTGMESKLADLLLDPEAAPVKVQAHVDHCGRCRGELAELRATMALLDTWEGPEPSPYFLSRLDARMREEREAAPADWPASWVARLRARLTYGPAVQVRPAAERTWASPTGTSRPRLRKPPWYTICKRWITTPNCSTS